MSEGHILDKEKEHLTRGQDYVHHSRLDEAIAEFKQVLGINPANAWGYIELGKIYKNRSDFGNAEKAFRKALGVLKDNEQAEQAHIGLGEVYRLQGKYDLADKEFSQVMSINPQNQKLRSWMESINSVKSPRKEIPPYRVFFTWGMHYQCNYRCSYCYAPKPEKACFNEQPKNCANYLSLQEWISVWDKIYDKYGTCRIRLDGGEPSAYPSFIELVEAVSQKHLLQINTNLSFDADLFVKRIRPERVRIDGSLHLEYVTGEEFFAKVQTLHRHKFRLVVSCVAYPPFIDKINDCKRPFEGLHIPFIIHPFSGEFNGKSYPKAYEMEEVSEIYSLDEASRLIMGWRKGENRITKGKLCRMGQIYGRIYPNGDVYRCCAENGLLKLGNICDDTFKLLDKPLECSSDNCPCWKSMIVSDEQRWTHLWLDDWELP
jgi:MoaA/NifB/PqqE/SkfB family radical SAM enzyme